MTLPLLFQPFAELPTAPDDPILGLSDAFRRDPRPEKVNLGIGVYQNGAGAVPLLDAVRAAEERLVAKAASRSYRPIEGHAAFRDKMEELVFGKDSSARKDGRVVSAQTIAGSGALRLGADLPRSLYLRAIEVPPNKAELLGWDSEAFVENRPGSGVEGQYFGGKNRDFWLILAAKLIPRRSSANAAGGRGWGEV